MEGVTILLDDRRLEAVERVDLVSHVGAAVSLLSAGLAALPAPDAGGTALAGAELAVAAMLLAAVARELRPSRRHDAEGVSGAGVGWINLFAAAALFAETAQRYHDRGTLSWATFLLGGVTLGLGLLNPRIVRRRAERRFFRADDAGVELRSSRLRGFRLAWSEVAAVERDGDALLLRTRTGAERRIGLRRYRNGEAVAAALLRAAAARGVPGAGG